MARPRIPSEDPNIVPASPEQVYDEMILSHIRYSDGGLMVELTRVDDADNVDPTDKGLAIRFRQFDAHLDRASNLKTAWNNMLRGLAALYRERRLTEKIAERRLAGGDTAALEASLTNVRILLGVS